MATSVSPPDGEGSGHLVRCGLGGVLMGLANLVPGISGGTMLLAAGVYPAFIDAIAALTTLRFKRRDIFTLAAVVGSALLAILLFAGGIKNLVVHQRWLMYSLFIGLTLGGIPVVWSMAKPQSLRLWAGAGLGFIAMAALALMQGSGGGSAEASSGWLWMFLAGLAGASAMILPGVSGGYLLLLLGVYVPILTAIDTVKVALKAGDLSALMTPVFEVVVPVGLGVLVGVLGVSNLLRMLLSRFPKVTLGALLGLLAGAVVGLWPFQAGVAPKVGEVFRGQVVTAESLALIKPEKFPTEFFTPSAGQVVAAMGVVLLGFVLTMAVAKVGQRRD